MSWTRRQSTLYSPKVNASDFYNMTDMSQARAGQNGASLPFGFFHHPLSEYPDGYPVVFDTHLSMKRAQTLLLYLGDGELLNSKLAKSMSLQVSERTVVMRQLFISFRSLHVCFSALPLLRPVR